MKRVTIAIIGNIRTEKIVANLTMDKRCYKTHLRKMHEEPDFGKRIKINDYYTKHRTKREELK